MATFDASKLNLPFMKYRLTALVVSLVLVIGSLLLLGTKGVNFSVDFSGGVALQLEFESPVNVGDIRKTLSDMGKGQATIQAYDERNVLGTKKCSFFAAGAGPDLKGSGFLGELRGF